MNEKSVCGEMPRAERSCYCSGLATCHCPLFSLVTSDTLLELTRADLAHPAELGHPEEQLPELAGQVRVVGHGVVLQRVHHLLLAASHRLGVLQPASV